MSKIGFEAPGQSSTVPDHTIIGDGGDQNDGYVGRGRIAQSRPAHTVTMALTVSSFNGPAALMTELHLPISLLTRAAVAAGRAVPCRNVATEVKQACA